MPKTSELLTDLRNLKSSGKIDTFEITYLSPEDAYDAEQIAASDTPLPGLWQLSIRYGFFNRIVDTQSEPDIEKVAELWSHHVQDILRRPNA